MNVVIIDGQGGQLGAQLVKEITALPNFLQSFETAEAPHQQQQE